MTTPDTNKNLPREVIVNRWSKHQLIAFTTMALLTTLVFTDCVNLAGKTTASSLSSYPAKLEFLFRYQTLNVASLLFAVGYVISFRATTKAINILGGHEQETQVARNILANSLEQYLISLSAQLVSLSFLSTANVLRVIPLINLLFIIGRVIFWIGYPNHRFFGFTVNFIPSAILMCYNIFSFFGSGIF